MSYNRFGDWGIGRRVEGIRAIAGIVIDSSTFIACQEKHFGKNTCKRVTNTLHDAALFVFFE
ncbi:hypothetical protein [Helicobacter salomonis]|uniref:hypothetical protein n=1 Tax=Helicobacter salomonis TaxID=56878 RepID=UPI000CF1A913|nr:hypothetical protein [Helicobacter salomonis]